MAETPQNKPGARDWRFALTIGISIGVALPLSRAVTQGLEPSLGHWGAFLLSVVAAGAGGGLAALLVHWLLRRGGRAEKDEKKP
jgi:hypothetical protein